MCHLTLGDKRSQNIIIVLYFTWVGIQINDKTDYKSQFTIGPIYTEN